MKSLQYANLRFDIEAAGLNRDLIALRSRSLYSIA